ncbi:unnamed protein product, partial [Phaedon cochleariae]
MDDIEKTLHSSTLITTANVFSKVLENIRKQKDNVKDSVELRFLKEKCLSQDFVISNIAGTSLVKLVEDKTLPMEQTLAEIIASINTTKSYASLTNILGDLLYLDYKIKHDESKKTRHNNYNLCSPQHPFITLLIEHSDSWNLVLQKIQELQNKESQYFNHLLFKPVYLFCIFSPLQNSMGLFQHKIWQFLLTSESLEKNMFYDILCWLQIKNRNSLHLASDILTEALHCNSHSNYLDLLLLWQTSVLHDLVINRLNICPTIQCIRKVVQRKTHSVTDNCVLLIFAKIINYCSPVDLKDIFEICEILICKSSIEPYVFDTFKSSLLQWLTNPCILIEEAYKKADTILKRMDKSKNLHFIKNDDWELFTKEFALQSFKANSIVAVSLELLHLSLHLRNEREVSKWLDHFSSNCGNSLLEEIFHFICGLFLNDDFDPEVTLKVFTIILKCVDKNIHHSPKVLILILYKLTNCSHPQLYLALLRALPKMVVLKENIPKVIAALEALSQGSEDLFNLSLSLMYDAWKVDNKCYPYLESMLVSKDSYRKKWDRQVVKTFVIKQLCHAKPEFYGPDMVAHLSKILNDCDDDDGALPSALAIEAITILCRAEVIDIMTTWDDLLKKFKNDNRLPVVKSLCLLIQEIPRLSYTESYTELYDVVLRKLWEYIEFGDPEISEAALDSLTAFGLDQICPHIPEDYLEEKDESKPIAVNLVPGKTWINFLIRKGASTSAVNFIVKMISIEIDGYLKYVYQVKGPKEPLNYGYLPTHSILRGVGEFVKTWVYKSRGSIHDMLYIECLNILSKQYSKPLPPLDWCFLQELMHDSKTKKYCIDIASHQVVLSGSARRLMENYIIAITENCQGEDVINIFRNLKHLANSIQPVILKPFFETTIWKAIETNKADSENELLKIVLESLKTVLKHPDIQETNKTTIIGVLKTVMFVTDVQSNLFLSLMETVIMAPNKCLQNIMKLSPDCDEIWIEKVMKLKCFLAKNSAISPLNWINEIIDMIHKTGRNISFWDDIHEVFISQMGNPETVLWVLDLIGQIQAKVADRNDEHLRVEFDLFISAIVYFSGFHCFLDSRKNESQMEDLFPQALAALLATDEWDVCMVQMLEWLYHMNTEKHVPSKYRQLFGLSLRALRHETNMNKRRKVRTPRPMIMTTVTPDNSSDIFFGLVNFSAFTIICNAIYSCSFQCNCKNRKKI